MSGLNVHFPCPLYTANTIHDTQQGYLCEIHSSALQINAMLRVGHSLGIGFIYLCRKHGPDSDVLIFDVEMFIYLSYKIEDA